MLRVKCLSKTYVDGTEALKNVSFNVESGSFVTILGNSGSGKSTLLRCINRLVEPSKGRIFLGEDEITGANPAALRRLRRRIGMVFQQYNLVDRLTVWTNALTGDLGSLASFMGLVGYFPKGSVDHAKDHLERVGLGHKVNNRANALSGGQQQRVGIVRALMQNPEIILADEPVSSLDPASAKNIMNLLSEINKKNGVTILCNLHLPDLACKYGHRVLALKNGELVFDDIPQKLDDSTINSFYKSS